MISIPCTAYILQVHQNPNQVNHFIRQLISEQQADVFVHIDKKNSQKINGQIIKNPRVKILHRSINCEWGDISQVDATLLLLREVLASRKQYDFVCLRSGQDLLVKNHYKDFLLDNKGKIFMSNRNISIKDAGLMKIQWPKIARKRYTSAHPIRIYRRGLLSLYNKGMNIFPNLNKWPKDYLFYKGSQWFSIPYEVAKYIITFIDENEWYYKFFENTLVPDESFFHTLIMNSYYKKDVVNNNLYFLKWGETLSERNSPQYLTRKDITSIESSDCFFARKFSEDIDDSVIEYFANKVRFGGKRESDHKIFH